jgi:DNA-binding NtrC family response regulator
MSQKKTILIVDSERLLGELLKSSMENEELRVLVAKSCKEAQKQVIEHEPALVLLNPEIGDAMDLIETCRVELPGTAFLALVGSEPSRRMARRAGLDVIDKQDGLADLIHVLRTRLGMRSLPAVSGHHILVVDDEEEYRELMVRFLADSGYLMSAVADGREALDFLEKDDSVSVVLLDINMPHMGGLSTLAELHKRDPRPEVIMTTAIADQEIANRAIELGAFDYILKPPDLTRVESTISACLSHRRYKKMGLWARLFWG